jgi:hypothetical protein
MSASIVLAALATLLWLLLPVYYAFKLSRARAGKTHIPAWACGACLASWFLQWPVMALFGLGCAGGGCSGAGSVALQLALFIAMNVGPFWWLHQAFPKASRTGV